MRKVSGVVAIVTVVVVLAVGLFCTKNLSYGCDNTKGKVESRVVAGAEMMSDR